MTATTTSQHRRRTAVPRRRSEPIRLGVVSAYPPRTGRLATYTADLTTDLTRCAPDVVVSACVVDADRLAYRDPVGLRLRADDPSDYPRTALQLKAIGANAVLLVYVPGLFGGPNGRYVFGLTNQLRRLGVPTIVLSPTVGPCLPPGHADVLRALCRDATTVTVPSTQAAGFLVRQGLADPECIVVLGPSAARTLAAVARTVAAGASQAIGASGAEMTARRGA